MDNTILDHSKNNRFLLLKPILPIKASDDGKAKRLSFLHTKEVEVVGIPRCLNISNGQNFSFINNLSISVNDSRARNNRTLYREKVKGYRETLKDVFSSYYNGISASYRISINLDSSEIVFNFDSHLFHSISFNSNRDVIKLYIRDNENELILENGILLLRALGSCEIYFKMKLNELSIDTIKEKYNPLGDFKLTLELHPNSKIKKFGIEHMGGFEGILYESNISGDFILSSYSYKKLHGYYFNSFTKEQGFYQNGAKVGFWKEKDQLVNYDKEIIFFILPIFPF